MYIKVKEQISMIVKKTLNMGKDILNKGRLVNCFELFGFDFMIDENLAVWLIEVNTNPCLEESNRFLEQLIPRVLGILNR